jgi:hypothetical protein
VIAGLRPYPHYQDTGHDWRGLPLGLQLGRIALDTAIQISLVSGHFGQVLLHADPRGGEELTRFYAGCMMAPVDPTDFPDISLTRMNAPSAAPRGIAGTRVRIR